MPYMMLMLIFFAAVSGFAFDRAGIPAGAMIGALAASAAFSLVSGRSVPFSISVRNAAQIGMGMTIASHIDGSLLRSMLNIIPALVLSTIFILASTSLLAWTLARFTGWHPKTCILSTSAGGLSQMVVIAEEEGSDTLRVGVLHLARYLSIIGGMPFLISWFLK